MASEDSKASVAYDMARQIWLNSNDDSPNLDTKDQFLDLVAECARALAPRYK